jgi:hypothetical protein
VRHQLLNNQSQELEMVISMQELTSLTPLRTTLEVLKARQSAFLAVSSASEPLNATSRKGLSFSCIGEANFGFDQEWVNPNGAQTHVPPQREHSAHLLSTIEVRCFLEGFL